MGRKRREKEELRAASDALAYEVEMFVYTFAVLQRDIDHPLSNAMIESYLAHARNLIDFFYPSQSPHKDDIIASDYFEPPDKWTQIVGRTPDVLEAARVRINKQLSHLTYTRLQISPEEKGHPIGTIFSQILKALESFVEQVNPKLLDQRLHHFEVVWQEATVYAAKWLDRPRT